MATATKAAASATIMPVHRRTVFTRTPPRAARPGPLASGSWLTSLGLNALRTLTYSESEGETVGTSKSRSRDWAKDTAGGEERRDRRDRRPQYPRYHEADERRAG